jgi:predicted nucleic acid-binding Zn ribbon protein
MMMMPEKETRREIKEGVISFFSVLCLLILLVLLVLKIFNYVNTGIAHF